MAIFRDAHKMTSKISLCLHTVRVDFSANDCHWKVKAAERRYRLHIPDTADGDIFGCSLFVWGKNGLFNLSKEGKANV